MSRKRRKATKVQTEAQRITTIVAERERIAKGTATKERLTKVGLDAVELSVGADGVQRISEAPLDRLWRDGRITQREYQAGDRLRNDARLARIDAGPTAINWDMTGRGSGSVVPVAFASDAVFAARQRYRAVPKAITGIVWAVLNNGVVHEHSLPEMGRAVFGREHVRDAAVAGHAGFRVALAALADHYGM